MSGDTVEIAVDDHWPADVESDQGIVVNWFVKEGAAVDEGDPLCELQVEKVSFDVPAPITGELTQIHFGEDEEFSRGDVLGVITPA